MSNFCGLIGFLVFFNMEYKASDHEEELNLLFKDKEFLTHEQYEEPLTKEDVREMMNLRELWTQWPQNDPLVKWRYTTVGMKEWFPEKPDDKVGVLFTGDSSFGEDPQSETWELIDKILKFRLEGIMEIF